MKQSIVLSLTVGCLLVIWPAAAQTPAGLPRQIGFSGITNDVGSAPVSGVTGITFAFYAEQTGGTPLWSETQNVQTGPDGHYTVLLGATKSEGLPTDLFTTEQAHWVGISIEGRSEQTRVLLVSAPYAFKAGDAGTLGGLPPSAFMLAGALGSPTGPANASAASASHASPALGGGGTVDYIPLWTDSSGDLGNSAIFQAGSGNSALIGINTASPASTLDVAGGVTIRGALSLPATGKATASTGKNSQPLSLAAAASNGSTSVAQTFAWQAEPLGNGTTGYSGTLNLLFGSGKNAPGETGLRISSEGQIAFAAGQTFPGAGTITGVNAGAGLTGGGSTGNITLNLDTTKVPQLATSNTFTANQTVNGTVTATSFSGRGAGLSGVNATDLGGHSASSYAQLVASNNFTGQQTMTGTIPSGVLQVTNTSLSGLAPAIVGTTDSPDAFAIKGVVTAVAGNLAGVYGTTASSTGFGMYGQSPNVGVYGSSTGSSILGAVHGEAGVWGDTGAANGSTYTGVLGTADGNFAGYFTNNSQAAATLAAVNYYGANPSAIVLQAIGDNDGAVTGCFVEFNGNLLCTGAISGVVPSGAKKISLYATQAAENWFEDAGSGQLSAGSARVAFDASFAQIANTNVEYSVFLTPKGDCEGLYVDNQTAQGFEVRELRGGHSNTGFAYRVMAKRKGSEKARLADVTEKYAEMERQQQRFRERMPQRAPAAK